MKKKKPMKESTKKNIIRGIMLAAAIAMILSFVVLPLVSGAEGNTSVTVDSFESGRLADALAEAMNGTDRNEIRSAAVSGGTLSASDYAALCDLPNLEYIELAGAETENGIVPDNALPARNQTTYISLPSNTLSIGNSAFSNCKQLKKISIPTTAESIGDYAFDGCISLEDISVPANLNHIGEAAFRDCQSLTEFTLPQGVTEIPAYCFNKCPFTEFYIGPQVTSIGEGAFSDCHELKDIYIYGDTAPVLGGGAVFQNLNVTVHTSDDAEGYKEWGNNFVSREEGFNDEYVPPETAAPEEEAPAADDDADKAEESEAAPEKSDETEKDSEKKETVKDNEDEKPSTAEPVPSPAVKNSDDSLIKKIAVAAVIAAAVLIAANVFLIIKIRKKNK